MPLFKKVLVAILIILAGALGAYFLFRQALLNAAIEKIERKVTERLHCTLSIKHSGFAGFARVQLTGISLIPEEKDTLFTCETATGSFSLARLLRQQPPIDNLELLEGKISLIQSDSLNSNFSTLMRSGNPAPEQDSTNNASLGYGELLQALWKRFLALADFNFTISSFDIVWTAPGYSERLHLEEFTLFETHLLAMATDSIDGKQVKWEMNGTINSRKGFIALEGACDNVQSMPIPFIKKITGFEFSLKSASLSLGQDAGKKEKFNLKFHIQKPSVEHWRIADSPVSVDSASAELNLITADSMLYISTNSRMRLNKINLHLLGEAGHTTSFKAGIHLKMDETSCQDFFSSLPHGLFNSLKGIEASGTVSYKLNFDVDTGQPDSVRFDSDFNASNFHINRFGEEDLTKMSRSFEYEARENDKVVKTFIVGPENHDFAPLETISPYLTYCVLTAEDGTFYFHKGFNEEAFRMSIATNIKEKRFARGGSTLSMQLVKNVHLNRDKTISRKVEEALLVWLIENNHLCSKERMLEVYLNIIEWGPRIYGITEAAHYYFNKTPAELNLEESIYLSSIIPNPKLFRYAFDQEGNLRPRLQGYFRLVAGRLLSKDIITQMQYDSLRYTVQLNGPARELVIPTDTLPADTTFIFEDPTLP